ncbi:MAG: hypothetical protein FWD59_07905 [Micrococcales bacterium]|nr:hypothetical protein [Micrococcales bacterium]
MRTTVNIHDELLCGARSRAAERGLTLSSYLEGTIRADLASHPGPRVAIELPTVNLGGPLPGFDITSNAEIFARFDEEDLARWSSLTSTS